MSRATAKEPLQCWKCGADVSGARLPEAREARCPDCEVDLHVCRMCRHYEPRLSGQCEEQRAEEVMNKKRANFCDWFAPRAGAFVAARDIASKDVRERLERLFGAAGADAPSPVGEPETARGALADLFKNIPPK